MAEHPLACFIERGAQMLLPLLARIQRPLRSAYFTKGLRDGLGVKASQLIAEASRGHRQVTY
jgi:hypothetical protein